MDIFSFEDGKLALNKENILLVKEFSDLWETTRNRIEGDKSGYARNRAFREFTYMYLVYDWDSPYKNQSEQERHLSAIEDSQMTDKFLKDEKFIAACKKYQDMQDTPQVRMLKAVYKSCEELTLFYTTADLQERDMDGKHILSHKQLIDSIGNMGKLIESLERLEEVVRKQKEANAPKYRGDVEPGYYD